jgi:integrator complex subunit 10
MEVDISDEEYVIQRAKSALKTDPLSAKAWMITAKTLYPNNFGVQFEAYCIEKNAGHVKEAAKCFSDLIGKFQQQPELWKEIENVTLALRAESDTNDAEKQFLCEMFKHISSDVQHKLLLCTADHCEDTMEHCRLLLLLLQRFPTAISSYGSRLVDTLISAEKHSHDGNFPLNAYRKLLVCELLPLLATENAKVDLSSKLLQKLLYKAVEFYFCYLGLSPGTTQDGESKIEDPWRRLFSVIEFIGKQLEWEPYLVNFSNNWNKESYWQRIVSYYQARMGNVDDKQLFFCASIFFFHCLHEYALSLTPESSPGQPQNTFILVEAFIDPTLPSPATEPKSKKRKGDDYMSPYISVERPELKNIHGNFLMAVNCWDLFESSEHFQREFYMFNSYLKLETWFTSFVIDYAIYKGKYEDAVQYLHKIKDTNLLLRKNINIAGILYVKENYRSCFEHILLAIPLLPNNNVGSLSNALVVGGSQRHLHYLPLTYTSVLQYFIKILIRCIKENMAKHIYSELAIGHILTLVQLDWPQEEEFVPPLMDEIQQHGSFNYVLFQNYIINVDILEEITYLWTNQGGRITLDIIPHMGQRRIGTRGADKGAKEEIKQIITRQVARSNENVNELLIRFITHERELIFKSLM